MNRRTFMKSSATMAVAGAAIGSGLFSRPAEATAAVSQDNAKNFKQGKAVFPNAKVHIARPEFEYWVVRARIRSLPS